IYSLGALTRGGGPPQIDELNMILNVPDKIPLGTTVPASVVVFDDRGRPIGDVDVSVSGAGVDLEGTGSGTTDVEGTFRFSVKGTGEGYTTITAHVDHDGNGDEKNRSITVVPGVPRMAFLQVMPDKLFLGPGESTIVDLLLLDGEGDPYVGGVIKLDEGMMGHGQVSATEYISDADGMASFTYTAPDQAPLNEHVVAYLSLRADPMENDLLPDKVNMVVQPIVVMNTGPSSWEMVRITDVTNVACDAANTTTEITIMVVDETGDPVEGATITAEFTNMDAIESADEEIMTNSTGHAVFKVVWDGTADTNATQMFFENGYISNGVGACVQLLFKGTTIKELYGGYTTLSVDGAPMMHPDDGGDLTFDIWIYDIDGNPADVDTAIIIGESADVSTAAMVDAPDYIMNSLLDFAGINIFTNADKGVMSSAGYFISTIMSDAELAGLQGSNLFETWKEPNTENYYEWWWGADLSDPETYPPFDDMEPFTVSGGHAQVSIEADSVVLSDNVPSLTVVPMGKAGFYATYDFSAWWWEFHGETAWRTEFVMQRTDKVYSVKNEVDNGILRPFGPGNVTEMRATVLDSTNEPVEGMDVTVHGSMWNNFWGHSYGSSYLDVGEPSPTDTTGTASFQVTGLPAFTEWHGNTPLTTLEKENLIIEPEPTYGATIQASMEVFILPLQLYTLVEVEPMVSQLGIVTEAEVTVTVTDGSGDRVPDADVALSCDRAAIITSSNLTDDQGQVTAVLEIPWVTTEEPFALPMIYIVAEKEAYVAGYSSLSSLYFLNLLPEISDVSIPETGHVTSEVSWSITGNATDDWGLEQVTASLDDSEPVVLTMTDDTWSFDMVDLAPGEHTVVFLAEDRGGRTATHEVTFVVNQLPEISVAVPKVGQKVNGTVEFSGA
ncbi:MAG: Ig-like domain-containing protein, partial [Thermoplasmata archaeon]|nr:Ig-like domain-containing protein [Thermoplasmata archaeon]